MTQGAVARRVLSKNARRAIVCGLLLILLTVALFLRTAHNAMDTIARPGSDSATYHYAAVNINQYGLITWDRDGAMARGEAAVAPCRNLAVGYPLFLALVYRLFPTTYQTVFILNVVLSLVLLWCILREMAISEWIALAALALAYPPFIYMISSVEIYIDDDITELMIVPSRFQAGIITIDRIQIDKYDVSSA